MKIESLIITSFNEALKMIFNYILVFITIKLYLIDNMFKASVIYDDKLIYIMG